MKVLIIDNYDSFTFNLAQMVNENGKYEADIIYSDCIDADTIEHYNKIIFSPGPGIPSDSGIMQYIVNRFGNRKSILGICLGHQAIAEAFGGKIYNLGRPCHGIKQRMRIVDRTDYIFRGLPSEIYVGLYHSWAVSESGLPAGLRITALSTSGVIMAVSHVSYDIKGVQFHPESVMTDTGSRIMNNWLDHKFNLKAGC